MCSKNRPSLYPGPVYTVLNTNGNVARHETCVLCSCRSFGKSGALIRAMRNAHFFLRFLALDVFRYAPAVRFRLLARGGRLLDDRFIYA